ncbi:MAG: ImmA/IrrE family metallo-endopeptidase [Spirochaetaceae bacterium]|nr:ImmA/IrrE family metallo-endopeptidase [Spirochaetaceae bacterium]
MTFSDFVKMLKFFANESITNGRFVLDLIDESLEDVNEEDEKQILELNDCCSYNPIKSEETARKYFDGSRKISRQNFEIIGRHYERNKFIDYLSNILLKTDDNYRHLILKLKEQGFETTIDNAEDICADIFDEIIATADKEYKKPSEQNLIKDAEQENFKRLVFDILKKLVDDDNWAFKATKYKILRNEIYELVQEDIDERFDIAIENYNGENQSPAIKLLIKCKKTTKAISKDELVIFYNKVMQVQGCTKAFFITDSILQKEALVYAKKMGIGVLRIFSDEKIKWLAPRTMKEHVTYIQIEKCEAEIEKALMQNDYEILNNFAVGCFENYYGNISSMFNKIFTGYDNSYIDNSELYTKESGGINAEDIKFISTDDIKNIARDVLFDIYGEGCQGIQKVEFETLTDYLKRRFGFSVEFPKEAPRYTYPQDIYGLIDYQDKKILIYGIETTNPHLLKFSVAHEISHLVLHKNLIENGKNNFHYFYKATKESKKMETQANMLASYIILNDKPFCFEFMKLIKSYHLTNKNGHYLYLDNQRCNVSQFLTITKELCDTFDVSREHVKYRLINLGWLKEPQREAL